MLLSYSELHAFSKINIPYSGKFSQGCNFCVFHDLTDGVKITTVIFFSLKLHNTCP